MLITLATVVVIAVQAQSNDNSFGPGVPITDPRQNTSEEDAVFYGRNSLENIPSLTGTFVLWPGSDPHWRLPEQDSDRGNLQDVQLNDCPPENNQCEQVCYLIGEDTVICDCYPGYALLPDGQSCKDIDECELGFCGEHGRCSNTAGSYVCTCNAGFLPGADGTCVDLDECIDPDVCGVVTGAVCNNQPGSFYCQCLTGFLYVTDQCLDIDECSEGSSECQQVCENDAGTYHCGCQQGFQLNADGHTCSDVDECQISNGGCEQQCLNTAGSYHCACQEGYVLGRNGNNQEICAAVCEPPCQNNGLCVLPNQCLCPPGFFGPHCSPVCEPQCLNGGRCIAPSTCQCSESYDGPICQTATCSPGCQNGGLCVRPNVCACRNHYTGPTCERRLSADSNDTGLCQPPCANDGVCVGYGRCRCSPGFRGLHCEHSFGPDCRPPCANGGTCLHANVCQCPEGTSGYRCQISVCRLVTYTQTIRRGMRRPLTEAYTVPCGRFGWNTCTAYRTVQRFVYVTGFKVGYRRKCEP